MWSIFDGLGVGIVRGLLDTVEMIWATGWVLILGFTLSGVVQSFVSRHTMERMLGNHGAGATVRASFFGMISSSCSYAASAMTRALIARGADMIAAIEFMVASTNLVLELGLALLILMGWQFLLGEYVGGAIMIVIIALLGVVFLRGRAVDATRARLREQDARVHVDLPSVTSSSLSIRDRRKWVDAATYTIADLTMLRRELLIGFVVAGLIMANVPHAVWNAAFIHGHGFVTLLENVIVGPAIAVVSFVCSVGNVPLAAALWVGGISFGGVLSFIFADLIAFPLILAYRRMYGWRVALRIVALLWVTMSLAGLATDLIFSAVHLVPSSHHLATSIASPGVGTALLNIIGCAVLGTVFWLSRKREWASENTYARDPICGMQVERALAPAQASVDGTTWYFCSDGCKDRFLEGRTAAGNVSSPEYMSSAEIDPICGMSVDPSTNPPTRERGGTTYYFCSEHCAAIFDAQHDPETVHTKENDMIDLPPSAVDPICSMTVTPDSSTPTREFEGTTYYFCCEGCAKKFDESSKPVVHEHP